MKEFSPPICQSHIAVTISWTLVNIKYKKLPPMTSSHSANEAISDSFSPSRIHSNCLWTSSWQPDNYDQDKDLEDVNAAQVELNNCCRSNDYKLRGRWPPSTHFAQVEFFNISRPDLAKKLQSIFQKDIKRPSQLERKSPKNYCRYLVQNAIKAMEEYDLPEEFKSYYQANGALITGFQTLKRYLLIGDGDTDDDIIRKMLFRSYLVKFLEEKASLYILNSKKKRDFREYLKYKNQVLMYYLRFPEIWNTNKAPTDQQLHHQHQHHQHMD